MKRWTAFLERALQSAPRIPPQVFSLTFFLLFSSCATGPQGRAQQEPVDVWEKPRAPQERVETHRDIPRASGDLDLVPGAQESLASALVENLPQAPSYPSSPGFETGRRPSKSSKGTGRPRHLGPPAAPPLEDNPDGLPEILADDMDPASLLLAIRRQLAILETGDPEETVPLGELRVSRGRLAATLRAFRELIEKGLSPEDLSREIRRRFYIIPAGLGPRRKVTFTGYYTPVIAASDRWSPDYPYPLYQKPAPHQAEELVYRRVLQTPQDYGFHLVATLRPMDLSREAIDGREVLADKNLEVAWLKDDLERYFLHVQGSGYLRFPDGRLEAVQYMGSNGKPYQSVGKMLIRDGVITPGQGSMQGIKQYFREHPEDIPRYLFKNKRYIFFHLSGTGPRGSSGAELVAGRSIATDKRLYPAGGLVFITARKPILNDRNRIARWERFSRFVLDQDTGAAIRGPGRADLYFGVGERAGAMAGRYMERGKMFYLLLK